MGCLDVFLASFSLVCMYLSILIVKTSWDKVYILTQYSFSILKQKRKKIVIDQEFALNSQVQRCCSVFKNVVPEVIGSFVGNVLSSSNSYVIPTCSGY